MSQFNEMQEGGKDEDCEVGDEEDVDEPAEQDLAEEVVSMNLIGGEENCPDVESNHALSWLIANINFNIHLFM